MVRKLTSVPADRMLTRSGLWVSGSAQLALPVEARGLSEFTIASGGLAISPDFDVLGWYCERWLKRPTESGWMKPTFYEVGSDLYGTAPSGKHYELLGTSLRRMALTSIEIHGFDGETGQERPNWFYAGHLLEATMPRRGDGLDRPAVRLAEWLRNAITDGAPIRLPWQVMRRFDENQKLAKRLWVYLAAERWKPIGSDREATWIAFGDRLQMALGMSYKQPRQARAALQRACETIRQVDDRFAAGQLHVRKKGRSYDIYAERPTWAVWAKTRDEYERTREAREQVRRALRQPPQPS